MSHERRRIDQITSWVSSQLITQQTQDTLHIIKTKELSLSSLPEILMFHERRTRADPYQHHQIRFLAAD